MQRGDQLTLSLELVNAQTENRDLERAIQSKAIGTCQFQSDVARDVSSKLKTKLSGVDVAKPTRTTPRTPKPISSI